jgi:hypothetical protein
MGVRPRRVAAHDEQALRVLQVVVAGRRRVGAQRLLVAGHRAAHAQARVGVDVVGAHQALGELVEDVVVLGEQLARHVEADRVRPVVADHLGELAGGVVQGGVPRHCGRRLAAHQALQRLQQPRLARDRGAGREVQRGALGAQAAEVGGVLGVAAHAGDFVAAGFDDDAAAHAAVGAGGPGLAHCSLPLRGGVGARGVDGGRAADDVHAACPHPSPLPRAGEGTTRGARPRRRSTRRTSACRECPAHCARRAASRSTSCRRPCRRTGRRRPACRS